MKRCQSLSRREIFAHPCTTFDPESYWAAQDFGSLMATHFNVLSKEVQWIWCSQTSWLPRIIILYSRCRICRYTSINCFYNLCSYQISQISQCPLINFDNLPDSWNMLNPGIKHTIRVLVLNSEWQLDTAWHSLTHSKETICGLKMIERHRKHVKTWNVEIGWVQMISIVL